jgi:hypothetical protein
MCRPRLGRLRADGRFHGFSLKHAAPTVNMEQFPVLEDDEAARSDRLRAELTDGIWRGMAGGHVKES